KAASAWMPARPQLRRYSALVELGGGAADTGGGGGGGAVVGAVTTGPPPPPPPPPPQALTRAPARLTGRVRERIGARIRFGRRVPHRLQASQGLAPIVGAPNSGQAIHLTRP